MNPAPSIIFFTVASGAGYGLLFWTGLLRALGMVPRTAGFGAEIAARLAESSMYDLVAPVERVTGYDTHIPLFRLEMKYLPSVDKIIAAAKRVMAAG